MEKQEIILQNWKVYLKNGGAVDISAQRVIYNLADGCLYFKIGEHEDASEVVAMFVLNNISGYKLAHHFLRDSK